MSLLYVLVGMCCVTRAWAQVMPLNDYLVQPEVWHPVGPAAAGVTPGGDLQLSVPVLTVPGRGLSFPIVFGYRAGITFAERAGWIGLGWHFDPGSLTREPEGGGVRLDEAAGVVRGYGVDAFEGGTADAQPDAFYLTLPAHGTVEVTQANTDAFDPATLPALRRDSFVVHDHRPWRIQGVRGTPGAGVRVGSFVTGQDPIAEGQPFVPLPDFTRFLVTTEDGTRYLFAAPTLAYFDALMDTPYAGQPAPACREIFVNTWRLVALFGPDYAGDALSPPADGEAGAWIRFEYRPVREAHEPEVLPTGPALHDRIVQTTYLRRIVTPTHVAVFDTEQTSDPAFSRFEEQVDSLHQRLTAIRLYSKMAATPALVEQVTLVQDHNLGPLRNGAASGTGRLRLQEIRFTGSDGATERPGYRFAYGLNPPCDPNAANEANTTDDFGYFRGEADGDCLSFGAPADVSSGSDAWSLTSIQYPTGARDVFTYENDRIDDARLSFVSYRYGEAASAADRAYWLVDPDTDVPIARRLWQGGTRVRRVARHDGMGGVASTTYAYGPGRLSGIPPRYWTRFETDGYRVRLYAPSRRGKAAVYYETIRQVRPDGSAVVTYYTTATHPSGLVRPLRPILLTHTWTAVSVYECRHADYGCGDFVVLQGNAHRNWGEVYQVQHLDTEGRVVREVIRSPNLAPHPTHPILARVWNVPGSLEDRVVHFGSLRVDGEQVRDYEAGTDRYVEKRTEWLYHARTGLLRATAEYGTGLSRHLTKTFAFEVPAYAEAFTARNRLDAVVHEHRVQRHPASGDAHHQAAAIRWRQAVDAQGRGLPFWKPWQSLYWDAEDPSEAPAAFTAWTTAEAPAGWVAGATWAAHDLHGNPLVEVDARGISTHLRYDGPKAAHVTGVERAGLSVGLTYHPRYGTVAAVTDANGDGQTYDYDPFGRLREVRNAAGRAVTRHTYTPSGGRAAPWTFDPHRPNRSETAALLGDGRQVVRLRYTDGLGRVVQEQQREIGNTYLVATRRYDGLGRLWQTWKPYRDASGGAFRSNDAHRAVDHYDGCSTPYEEQQYVPDGLGRAARTVPAHCGAAHAVQYRHGVEQGLHATWVIDEDGRTTRTLVDAFGQTVETTSGVGTGEAATTRFTYGPPGRVTTVESPNAVQPPGGSTREDWAIHYRYDSRGRLITATTPDAGTTHYRYDRAGNLRFVEDAASRADAARRFIYHKYDAHARRVESGVYAGPVRFEETASRADAAEWPAEGGIEQVYYSYDAYGVAAGHPPGADYSNPRGRLTEVAFGGGRYRYYYDDEGRITHLLVHLDGLEEKRIRYRYDLQGNVVQTGYQEGAPDAFHSWYRYDDAGRLREVRTHDRDRLDEAYVDARYHHDADGQVRQVQLGSGAPLGPVPAMPVQTVDYRYHIRGWLSRINDVDRLDDSSARTADRFALQLGYDGLAESAPIGASAQHGGNIAWAAWRTGCDPCTPNVASMPTGAYAFRYDGLNRMTSADFSYRGVDGGAWRVSTSFDVGAGDVPITYDPNGNLTRLTRRDDAGAANVLDYGYSGSNRLLSLRQSAQGGVEEFLAYDANGNLTQGRGLEQVRYDFRNLPLEMTRAADGRSFTYRYDAAGRRVAIGLGDAAEAFFVRGRDGTVVAVYDGTGELRHWNILAGENVIGRAVQP